jgi:hypothetical protein
MVTAFLGLLVLAGAAALAADKEAQAKLVGHFISP